MATICSLSWGPCEPIDDLNDTIPMELWSEQEKTPMDRASVSKQRSGDPKAPLGYTVVKSESGQMIQHLIDSIVFSRIPWMFMFLQVYYIDISGELASGVPVWPACFWVTATDKLKP